MVQVFSWRLSAFLNISAKNSVYHSFLLAKQMLDYNSEKSSLELGRSNRVFNRLNLKIAWLKEGNVSEVWTLAPEGIS